MNHQGWKWNNLTNSILLLYSHENINIKGYKVIEFIKFFEKIERMDSDVKICPCHKDLSHYDSHIPYIQL